MTAATPLMQAALLAKIDALFACNVGEYVHLPQLVVVGAQSSGKSSLLAALTQLPFPRDKGLCTRFATQIIFRRAPESITTVSIIPAEDCSREHREALQPWQRQVLEELDAESFSKVMKAVATAMGVGAADTSGATSAFSKDVLVIEVSGPDQGHLSIIDVPGIIKSETKGVTTKQDIATVDAMVQIYMENSRSVMLVVVPSPDDLATHEIVQRAEQLDPTGDRIFGVLTRPDLVDPGAEGSIVEMAQGKSHCLKLDWHIVKNSGQARIHEDIDSRDAAEASFFATEAPWKTLDKSKVGISALRNRLQDILAAHIKRQFPKVKAEISVKLKDVRARHKALGPKRQDEYEQREFLIDIASQFHAIADLAIRADYGRSAFFKREEAQLRLATAAINRGQVFADVMAGSGHSFGFNSSYDERNTSGSHVYRDCTTSGSADTKELALLSTRQFGSPGDIDDILSDDLLVGVPDDGGILAWMKDVHLHSHGFELGTFDPAFLRTALMHQASKWEDIAMGYISDIIALVHYFVTRLLEHVLPGDAPVRRAIELYLSNPLKQRYEEALAHTKFLLRVELRGTPATYKEAFNDALQKGREKRVAKKEQGGTDKCPAQGGHDERNVYEMHDILQAYYEPARKRFVDNVRMQVADFFLVTGDQAAVRLLSPSLIAGLGPGQLEKMTGEEEKTKRERARLVREMQRLEQGKSILR